MSTLALTALVPILVRVLGAKEYGAWVLTGGIVNYITLVDFGMSLTIARFVALGYRRNRREAEEAIGVGLGVVAVIGIAIVAVTLPAADGWQRYLDVQGSAFALRVAALALLLLLVSKVLQSALEGSGKVGLSRLLQAANTLAFSAAAATVVFFTAHKLQALSIVLLASSIISAAVYWLFLMREWDWGVPAAVPDRAAYHRVVGYAVTMQGGSIVGFSVDPISRYILAAAAGPAAVTPLDLALRAARQWFGAALALTGPVLPSLGHLAGAAEVVAKRTDLLWKRVSEVAVATGGYLAVLVYFLFPPLFGHVGRHAGHLGAVGVLLWTPAVIAIVPYLYIVLFGRARQVFMIQLITSGVGIALLLGLVWSIGAWAPVLGLGIGSLVGSFFTVRIARKLARGAAPFRLPRISVRAAASPVVALLVFLVPIPLAVRALFATVIWTLLCFPSIRAMMRALATP